MKNIPTRDLIMSRVVVDPETGCWNWVGCKRSEYPTICIGGKSVSVSKASWEIFNQKKAPDGLNMMHSCDNTRCANPDHIRPGTRKENIDDIVKKGRNKGHLGIAHSVEAKAKISAGLRKYHYGI